MCGLPAPLLVIYPVKLQISYNICSLVHWIRNRRMVQVKQRRVGSGLGMVTNFAFGFLLHENLCINNNNNLHYQFDSPSFSLFISQLSHCLSFSPLSSSVLPSSAVPVGRSRYTISKFHSSLYLSLRLSTLYCLLSTVGDRKVTNRTRPGPPRARSDLILGSL